MIYRAINCLIHISKCFFFAFWWRQMQYEKCCHYVYCGDRSIVTINTWRTHSKCPKINFFLNLFIWILIFMAFYTHEPRSVNSMVHKFATLSWQVSPWCNFFFALSLISSNTICILFLIVSRNLHVPEKYDDCSIVSHFVPSTQGQWQRHPEKRNKTLKLTKVSKIDKMFILNFISARL